MWYVGISAYFCTMEKNENKKLKAPHYRLQLINSRRNRLLFSFPMSAWTASLLVSVILLLTAVFVIFIMTRTPLRTFLPGYLDFEKRTELVETALRLDSLEQASNLRSIYLQNLTDILSGRVQADTIARFDSATVVRFDDSLRMSSPREQAFVSRMEEYEKYGLNTLIHSPSTPSLVLVHPLNIQKPELLTGEKGISYLRYPLHKACPVWAPLDGTVISVEYKIDGTAVIVMQHAGDLVSVLSNLCHPMAEQGRSYKAGAVIGQAGEDPERLWVDFSLWNKGKTIDPRELMMPE